MGMSAILVIWPRNLYVSLLTYCKESSYEIWVRLAEWFLRKLCLNILMGLQYEQLDWKVNLDLWNLFIAIVTLNLSSENNDIGFSSFQKINFSQISPLGSKFDLDVK